MMPSGQLASPVMTCAALCLVLLKASEKKLAPVQHTPARKAGIILSRHTSLGVQIDLASCPNEDCSPAYSTAHGNKTSHTEEQPEYGDKNKIRDAHLLQAAASAGPLAAPA